MEAKTISIGIDLGTTNSVMARIERKNARVLDNQDSEQLTASVVHITEGGDVVVGKEARNYGGRDPRNTVFSIKRFMGRDFEDPEIQRDIQHAPYQVQRARNGEVEVILRGQAYSPAKISSFILAQMKKDAEVATDQEVTHAVITVPAYFGNRQRKTTRMAGQIAGLNVLRIIPEPTAAALAYGFEAGMEDPKTVLVYDLGGGTFDVTVMSIVAGNFIDMGKTGDMHLGGDDFDQKIMDWITEQILVQNNVDIRSLSNAPEVLYNLKYVAEQAKIRLGRTARTQVILPAALKTGNRQIDLQCELTREVFNQMIRPLVRHSIDLVHEAITRANNTVNEIDAILLVGGSTKVPLVEELLREVFGEKVIHGNVNPMHCVAQGAAFQTLLPPEPVEEVVEDAELEEEEKAHPQKSPQDQEQIEVPPRRVEASLPEKECSNCGKLNPGELRDCKFCGASLTGGIQQVHEKIPVPIGVQVEGDQFEVVLDDNMYYPTLEPILHLFRTTKPGQAHVRIPIYEGFKLKASENNFLGEVEGQLPAGLPENTAVAVSIAIDANGILYVTASLPDRPGTHIQARMDWKNRVETPAQPRGGENGQADGGAGPADWRDAARGTLGRAGLVLDEAQGYVSDETLDNIRRLGTQLKMAIDTNDIANGKNLMERIEPEIEKLGIFMVLGFARHLSQDPELSAKVGFQKADELSQAVARADRCKVNREWDNFVKVVDNDVMKALAPYMEILGGSGGMVLDDLLRASSTSQLGNM